MGVPVSISTIKHNNNNIIFTAFNMQFIVVLAVCLVSIASAGNYWRHGYRGNHGYQYRRPTVYYYKHHAPAAATMESGASRDATVAAPELPTIAAAAIGTETLSTLVTAVKAAGLVDTLSGEGTFTVFAPNNAAFGNIPSTALTNLLKPENIDQLKAVLLRHVLPSVIKADDIPQGITSLKTAGGEDISVTKSDGKVTIQSSSGQANVIATDIIASNGVVHIVDTVF